MLAFTTASPSLAFSSSSINCSTTHGFAPVLSVHGLRRRRSVVKETRYVSLSFVEFKESGTSLLGFSKGFVSWCSRNLGGEEGDSGLEAAILEFMKDSNNPEAFPSKKELVDNGRMDLVDAIRKRGGWLSFGWDLDDTEGVRVLENGGEEWGLVIDGKCESFRPRTASEADESPSSLTVPSPRFLVTVAGDDESGIEGILNRLEKQRTITLGFGLLEKEERTHVERSSERDDSHTETSIYVTGGFQRSMTVAPLTLGKGALNDIMGNISQNRSFSENNGVRDSVRNDSRGDFSQNRSFSGMNGLRDLPKPETWRTWSLRKAGFQDGDFEAAEIVLNETGIREAPNVLGDDICGTREISKERTPGQEDLSYYQIRSRLEHLELELSSTLRSLRSNKADEIVSRKIGDQESSSEELQKVSDAWEFQETEIMNAQNKLRSIRAKLAVIDGKMALAIIDAQKMVEEKQKRIDDARRASRLLRTTCIFWTNSASEVLLAGSFDGWATQRKMEKSASGIFSLTLKLYPGRYEIKFIVDGMWRIDQLCPTVHNNGYENNLLIIT